MDTSRERFLQVIDKHQGIIRSLSKGYYPCLDDRQDAEQDIILQLWKSFDTFRGEAAISTWVYRVSLNTILGKLSKEQRQPQKERISPVHENQEAATYCDDDLRLLHQLIASLNEIDKGLVMLYLDGYSTKEMADLLSLSQSNVTTRISRIKRNLKSRINKYSHELR